MMTGDMPTDQRRAMQEEAFRPYLRTYDFFNQGTWWLPKDRDRILIADMDLEWRFNAALWLERRAAVFEDRYSWGENLSPWGLLSEDNAMDLMPHLEWAEEERKADPVAWIRRTRLYRALVKDLPAKPGKLARLARRARHWSSCSGRSGDGLCTCEVGPMADEATLRAVAAVVRQQRPRKAAKRVMPPVVTAPADAGADLSDSNIDSTTGRQWGVGPDGFDHHEPHGANDWCHFDSCRNCFGYHCDWFCEEIYRERHPDGMGD